MKFLVSVLEVYAVEVEVEADDEIQARDMAAEIVDMGDLPEGEYRRTLDASKWPITRLDKSA